MKILWGLLMLCPESRFDYEYEHDKNAHLSVHLMHVLA